MDDPEPKRARVVSLVERYNPAAGSLLELGCGTGTMLAGLGSLGALSGIDRSPEMLAVAREKVSSARLIEADITTFELGERFDVVICVFDTLNHVTSFERWQALFARVHAHLEPSGLFIFDVNTVAKLRGLAAFPPWFEQAGDTTVVQNVDPPVDRLSTWNVWIVEPTAEGGYVGYHEPIGELAVDLDQIEAALTPTFELLDAHDDSGEAPSAQSQRVHYAWRRRDITAASG
jgi:SAM-dependent methyltransferase